MNKNIIPPQEEKLLDITTITHTYRVIDIYLTDSGIGGTSEHIEQIRAIQDAEEHDTIRVHCLNCIGGDANTIIALLNALANTAAHTVCFLEGQNSSAGSMPFLVCNDVVVGDYSSIMIHTVSGNTGGTIGNTFAETQFSNKMYNKFLDDIYYAFLTENELTQVKDGKELYFDSDEIRERLEKRAEIVKKEIEEEMQDVASEQQ